MNGRSFLTVADTLLVASTEEAWRSAVSRAYYAIFHVGRDLLLDILQVLDAAITEPTRSIITNVMKIYERDVLKDVTWHP